ncbi:hypothetical protein [Actinomyces howellii]|uniref:Uncharacterized protein n=1 Tax=Actinomyces howellii TaxID=52771 RepID=A0A448HDK5_9ACTO|nr:hypothetical protein [Actinomyces howellii]VEG25792.1 Uncharacterised protein [Actinomyces howellii]
MIEHWNEFLESHPFDVHLKRTSATEYVLEFEQLEELPLELPVLFGEWLYNLRSALDYTIWAAATYAAGRFPPPNQGRLQYPICDTEDSWRRTVSKLSVLPPHHLDMLKRMQPFASDPDANYLGWINRLARIDRHRHFTAWTARVAIAEPIAQIPSGVKPKWEWGERLFRAGSCYLARMTFPDKISAEGVLVNPRVGIDPEVTEWGQSPFWSKISFDERIRKMMLFVSAEIDTYDYDCTGRDKARAMLTDEFVSQSDQRRARVFKTPRVPGRSEVSWTSADPSRSGSSWADFVGVGFPADGPGVAR